MSTQAIKDIINASIDVKQQLLADDYLVNQIAIVTEVITKVVLYYLHERVWLHFLNGRSQTKKISFFKAVSWRTVGTIDTMLLGWFYSGNPLTGLKIGMVEVMTKIILYYFHERVWHTVPIGSVRKWFGLQEK
jgi:uncharacterized membrane protein